MKKILLITLVFLIAITAHSEEVVCPQTITCNYDEGTCDLDDTWNYSNINGGDKFLNNELLLLSNILAFKKPQQSPSGFDSALHSNKYVLVCWYKYGDKGSTLQTLKIVDNLKGSGWVLYNFGKTHAKCNVISNREECAANIK